MLAKSHMSSYEEILAPDFEIANDATVYVYQRSVCNLT